MIYYIQDMGSALVMRRSVITRERVIDKAETIDTDFWFGIPVEDLKPGAYQVKGGKAKLVPANYVEN